MQYLANELSHIKPRDVGPVVCETDAQIKAICENYPVLKKYGIGFDERSVREMMEWATGMDADLTTPLTTASITTPVQFLQAWLPGFVEVITAARRIDTLVGITTQGSWEDEEIVQGVLERTGNAVPYGDYTNTPLSSWNLNYERRTIVRFEEGMTVGRLEEARAAAVRVSAADSKRSASANSLEIERNRTGFRGYNEGANRTYGFLNDTDLPAYVDLPDGAGGTSTWASKTYLEIVSDLLSTFQMLRTGSLERVDPKQDPITLAIATDAVDYLSTVSQFGNSVQQWLNENYPNTRVESAPELNDADGSDNVFYMFAEEVNESGTDDNRTFVQVVPTKFQTLGVDQKAKSYTEAYSNATSGIMTKRPYAIIRRSGV